MCACVSVSVLFFFLQVFKWLASAWCVGVLEDCELLFRWLSSPVRKKGMSLLWLGVHVTADGTSFRVAVL